MVKAFKYVVNYFQFTVIKKICIFPKLLPTAKSVKMILSLATCGKLNHFYANIADEYFFRRYWMGFRKDCLSCEYQWADFSPVDYVNWEQTDDIGASECAYFDNYHNHWQEQHCNSVLR